ncbi:MAG: OmpA family protein [Prevotella sp.]|uniref:OmpA family protein n=1 Tax=Prevotella sp. TaxID=59823 RepID=UPI002A348811|nr:OmpA family protein [Prevotella sp.]MDD7317662.1 OmpA family protein [Prevotellaceae bacterium]MDY4020491.1 OmpA family protein [Prevotella sp.]
MKKLFVLLAAAAMTLTASAQALEESKTFDNFYIGINGGVSTKMTGQNGWLGGLNPNAGLRIGRWFTPVFGIAVEGNAYFSNKSMEPGIFPEKKTFVRYTNVGAIATVNLSNWFGGYTGEPRSFEVVAIGGLGWGHQFGTNDEVKMNNINNTTAKAGLDFAFNLGSAKAWQIYVEPAVTWGLNGPTPLTLNGKYVGKAYTGTQFNVNRANFQLNAGIVYKFKNSNGTHNFKVADLRNQAEIDRLNGIINGLRNDLDAKDREISRLQKLLDECNARVCPECPESKEVANLQPTVLFRQGKSVIDPAQYAPIELISNYMKNHPEAKVKIDGYASPEGSLEINKKLSIDRAEAVKNALVKKYKIAADRLTIEGHGPTDKLFEQVEFNRVVTFHDTTK